MPRHYRGFEARTVQAHATIAFERGNAQVRLGVWRKLTGGGVAICIAALDRPGLLLSSPRPSRPRSRHHRSPDLHPRSRERSARSGRSVLGTAPPAGEKSPRDHQRRRYATVETLLADLIAGDELANRLVQGTIVDVPYSAPGMTSVRFEDDEDGAGVLLVQSFDRPGLLLTISRCLFCLDVQVVRSDVSTSQGRVLDKFHLLGFDGRSIREARKAHNRSRGAGGDRKLGQGRQLAQLSLALV